MNKLDSDLLTSRQREVVILVVSGFTSKEIASKLGIRFKTVVVHRYNAMRKLKVHNVAALIRVAIQMGLVEPN
jgi:DNA-binding NarL/FixJ family response regulator